MGKISILTKGQKIILDELIQNNYLRENYYLTGGTALSEFYLHHRYSDDMDFFTEKEIDQQYVFTFWDLIYGVQEKFKGYFFDVMILAQDFLKVEDFDVLPRMIKPLNLEDLKKFFREKAKEVGSKTVIRDI